MALSINTNLASMAAVRRMDGNMEGLKKSFERLTSGLRVNSSKDDTGGFAVSQRLSTQIRGMNVAIRNVSDGISLMQVADAALDETTNALQKMRDIMIAVGSPSLTEGDRNVIQSDVNGLISEVQRIADSTKFNGKLLLSGGFDAQVFQVGADMGETLTVSIQGAGAATLGVSAQTTLAGVETANAAIAIASQNIAIIDAALSSVSNIRARLGTYQNRFESVITGLNNMVSNTETAHSRLVDADVATEAANLTRLTIMQQASAAVLAQANSQPNVMLQLLRG